jgi:hypothetical protein
MRIRFGECVLDSETRELLLRGSAVHLSPKGFQFLELLLESRPRALSKSEIHEKLWPGTFVSGPFTSSCGAFYVHGVWECSSADHAVPLGMFCYNLLHFSPEMVKNPLYMFIGYRTEISSLKHKKHLGLLEKFELDESGSLKRGLARTGLNFDADQRPELEEYLKKGLIEKDIWVTPGLPFMLSITAGFITTVVFGDLIFYTVMRLMVG